MPNIKIIVIMYGYDIFDDFYKAIEDLKQKGIFVIMFGYISGITLHSSTICVTVDEIFFKDHKYTYHNNWYGDQEPEYPYIFLENFIKLLSNSNDLEKIIENMVANRDKEYSEKKLQFLEEGLKRLINPGRPSIYILDSETRYQDMINNCNVSKDDFILLRLKEDIYRRIHSKLIRLCILAKEANLRRKKMILVFPFVFLNTILTYGSRVMLESLFKDLLNLAVVVITTVKDINDIHNYFPACINGNVIIAPDGLIKFGEKSWKISYRHDSVFYNAVDFANVFTNIFRYEWELERAIELSVLRINHLKTSEIPAKRRRI